MAYATDVIGGVPDIPDTCLGDVITDFYQQNGVMNEMISRGLEMESPLVRLGNRTKVQFPAQSGDIYTKVILTSTRPPSSVGKAFTPLKSAGYNSVGAPVVPTCRTPELVRYGHLKTSACLERFSLRTPDFNAVDLTFKFRRDQQWNHLMTRILPDWSMGTQKYWYREAFRKNVWNVVLTEGMWRAAAQMGAFSTVYKPTTTLNPDFLDELYRWLQGYGANQSPYTTMGDGMTYQALITGPDEARYLDELDRAANSNIGSRWSNTIVIPGYGNMRTIRNWVIMVEDDITRLKENANGTYTEVDATIEVPVAEGTESVANPDYYNPAVAKYTASYAWNSAATEWYVPPDFTRFPNQIAGNWNGSFSIINMQTPADPKAENAYFLADFAFGMGPRIEPRRAAVILSLAVHKMGRDTCVDYGTLQVSTAPTVYPIKNVYLDSVGDKLLFESEVAINLSPGTGEGLYLITSKGTRAKINGTPGSDVTLPYQKYYSAALVDTALHSVRECDPWVAVSVLPNYEPTTTSVTNDCVTCGGPLPVCDYTATITSPSVQNIRLADGTQLNDIAPGTTFHFPYTVAATLQTDLAAWVTDEGTATAAFTGGVWTITVTSTIKCFGQVVGESGTKSFTQSNCAAS